MQGIKKMIPTARKIAYINKLMEVGFDSLDFGSFVSPDIIPQMADTAAVLEGIDCSISPTKLIAIVANERGATEAVKYKKINYLGFPFSVSETFQKRNTNSTIEESLERVKRINSLCKNADKELILYLSMGFGNPYGDAYSPEIVMQWMDILAKENIGIFMLSDTIGIATPTIIAQLFDNIIKAFPNFTIGAHLHSAPHNWRPKIEAAYQNGCRRFDAAIKGLGGCPMAKDDLIGNMATENLLNYFNPNKDFGADFSEEKFATAFREANSLFAEYH